MAKATITLHDRIAVRAYYLALNGASGSDLDRWLDAERTELALVAKRSLAAQKGAQRRRDNAANTAALKIRARGARPQQVMA